MSKTRDGILDQLRSYINSAALGAALELGLFWQLDRQPQDATDAAKTFGIPKSRCLHWLLLLKHMGFLEEVAGKYMPSPMAHDAILDAYSQATWAFLARESRARLHAVKDLPLHIRKPSSTWAAQELESPDYFAQMQENPEQARQFTRALFEVHQPLANELAKVLDLTGTKRLMDLGGGSGVQSFALLKRWPQLTSMVVDIPNVCVAGREIAAELSMEGRISYYAADFIQEELPKGFDIVLECDVGAYDVAFFRKLRASLNSNGRLVIVDELKREEDITVSSDFTLTGRGQVYAFLASLENPNFKPLTIAGVKSNLTQAGYEVISEERILSDMAVIQAQK